MLEERWQFKKDARPRKGRRFAASWGRTDCWPKITSKDIEILKQTLRKQNLKPPTINRYLAALKTALLMGLRKWQALTILPYIEMLPESPPRLKVYTDEEEAIIIEELNRLSYHDLADLFVHP